MTLENHIWTAIRLTESIKDLRLCLWRNANSIELDVPVSKEYVTCVQVLYHKEHHAYWRIGGFLRIVYHRTLDLI